jgi:hypothetical protein
MRFLSLFFGLLGLFLLIAFREQLDIFVLVFLIFAAVTTMYFGIRAR